MWVFNSSDVIPNMLRTERDNEIVSYHTRFWVIEVELYFLKNISTYRKILNGKGQSKPRISLLLNFDDLQLGYRKKVLSPTQRTNGPINAHLIAAPDISTNKNKFRQI